MIKKHTIKLHPLGKSFQVNHQTPLIDVLHEFGVEFPCGGKGTCGKCKIRILDGNINVNEKHQQKLDKLSLASNWRLACCSNCTTDITLEIEQYNHIILADESEFAFTSENGYGIAVDLGTTTIVAQLVDLSTARVLEVETLLNPQVKFGADLISRIQACIDGNSSDLTRLVREAIGEMINRIILRKKIELKKIVLVGNTVMQLLFSGDDVTPLATYPFHTDNLGMKTFKPDDLGWNFEVNEGIRFWSSIGSFVGSDILAGIVSTGLHLKNEYTALIDLGTNGEIVVGNNQRILCASTAAGPAFEGSNISMGMRAVTGAVSSVKLIEGKMIPAVIGNTQPKGICGSALIDAVAILRKTEEIGMFGEIISGEKQVTIAGKVKLSQKDIHEFQLAKAAIAAGLAILCKNLSIFLSDISQIYIAGGFGNYINLAHVVSTGMIEADEVKIHKMGNTALIGAKMFLFSMLEETDSILEKTFHINLEGDPLFHEIYIDRMIFP